MLKGQSHNEEMSLMEEAPSQVAEVEGRKGSGEWGQGVAYKPETSPGTHILPASLPLPQPSGRGLPSPFTPPSLRVCALPGCHASSSRCVPGPPGTYATRTRGLTLSWSVSTEPSLRRCPAAKAMSRTTRAARSRQTEGEGKGGGAACPKRGGKHLLPLPCSVDTRRPPGGREHQSLSCSLKKGSVLGEHSCSRSLHTSPRSPAGAEIL